MAKIDFTKMSGQIRLDAEGVWYHDGVAITQDKTVQLLNKSVCQGDDGRFYLSGEDVPVPVTVADVAFFVTGISKKGKTYKIQLSDGTTEVLDITTLDVGNQHQLYCDIKSAKARASFQRKVYNGFVKSWDKRDEYYGLVVDDLFYPIQSVSGHEAYKSAEIEIQKKKEKPKFVSKAKLVLSQPIRSQSKKKTVKKSAKKTAKKAAKKVEKKATKKVAVKKTVKKTVAKKAAKKKAVKKAAKKVTKKAAKKKVSKKVSKKKK